MILSVLFKPYIEKGRIRIGLYWAICLFGAIVVLACGVLPLKTAWDGITANTSVNPLKILALFLSMTLISEFLDDAGFFDYLSSLIFVRTKGGALKLFVIIYAVVSVLTVFTSNDIIILTFTPSICIFCKKAKISPIPFLVGEFVAANTWSMALIVGNPTNIYLAGSFGVSFFEYFKVMGLPTIVGGLTGFGVLLLLFYKTLKKPIEKPELDSSETQIHIKKTPLIFAVSHLLICLLMLAVSDLIKVEMYLICLILLASLTLFNLVYYIIKERNLKSVIHAYKKAPYELIPFVLSMFIIVLALSNTGVTTLISNALITGEKTDGITFGFLSAFSANLLNNIPMSVLFEKIILGVSKPALYGAVIGSNIGAFITPVGALAGIMWNKILKGYGVKLSFLKFVLYGIAVAIPVLVASTLTLFLIV
jgi:arsenical pump membrane protein